MTEILPPIIEGAGTAPAAVCARWLIDHPCGAAAAVHVIWDLDMHNGPVCAEHAAEARRRWVFLGMHTYTAECAATNGGGATWLPDEDRCVIRQEHAPDGQQAAAVGSGPPAP